MIYHINSIRLIDALDARIHTMASDERQEGTIMITTLHRQPAAMHSPVSLRQARRPLESFIHRLRSGWDRWQTERAIEAMPAEMRKDIGWPTSDMAAAPPRPQQ